MAASSPNGTPIIVHNHITLGLDDTEEAHLGDQSAPSHPQNWHIFPILEDDAWGLFVIITYGTLRSESRPFDRLGYLTPFCTSLTPTSEGFMILPDSTPGTITSTAALTLLRRYAFPTPQNIGPPRTKLHPIIVRRPGWSRSCRPLNIGQNAFPRTIHTEPWRRGDCILHYFIQILKSLDACEIMLRVGFILAVLSPTEHFTGQVRSRKGIPDVGFQSHRLCAANGRHFHRHVWCLKFESLIFYGMNIVQATVTQA